MNATGNRKRQVTSVCPYGKNRFPLFAHLLEDFRRRMMLTMPFRQIFQSVDQCIHAEAVTVMEGAPQKRRKSETQNRPHVPVPGRSDHLRFEAEGRLIDRCKHQPFLDFPIVPNPLFPLR